jgi:hypothetical protein
MVKEITSTALIVILSMLLVASVAIGYNYYLRPAEVITINNTIYAQDNKPLMLFIMNSWGPLEGSTTKTSFAGYVYNYGFTEAKNVILVCDISLNKANLKTIEYNMGNIGSTSYKYISFSKDYVAPSDAVGLCRTKNSTEYISLDERLPVEEQ